MEAWFDSVKAEAASERRIREQATTRLGLMQERLDRLKEQVAAQSAENKAQPRPPHTRPSRHRSRLRPRPPSAQGLRIRLNELRDAEPDSHGRAVPSRLG